MTIIRNTPMLNCTLNGDTIDLLTSRENYARNNIYRATMPARRVNQTLAINTDGSISSQSRTIESELSAVFSRLGAALPNTRRNGRFTNPLTNRAITIRNMQDIRRLETRMQSRRFDQRKQAQQQQQTQRRNGFRLTSSQPSSAYNFGAHTFDTSDFDSAFKYQSVTC